MQLRVLHSVGYRYTGPVWLAPHQVLMRPRENHHVSVLRFRLLIEPGARLFWTRDHHDNSMALAHFNDRSEALIVRAEFEVELLDVNPFDFLLRMDAVHFPFDYSAAERIALAPYLETPGAATKPLLDWMRSILPERPDDTLELLMQLNRELRDQISYRERLTSGVQLAEETIRQRCGTCRDFALLMVQACRALGFAARFVSGYLFDASVPPGEPAGSLHAWAEVFLPGAGWKGLDPTHAILADAHFVPVAVGRNPDNLAPVVGSFWGEPGIRATMDTIVEVTAV